MTKVIVADKKVDCDHLVGQFLDESHYDLLVEEDCDFYIPASSLDDKKPGEDRVAFKFRKNYFSKEQQEQAYLGLREAATPTNNRGLAAGPRTGKQGNREWVTGFQEEVIKYFRKPATTVTGEDLLQEILNKRDSFQPIGNMHAVWLVRNPIDFEEWIAKTRVLPLEEQKKEAKRIVEDHISMTTYANEVLSGIAGAFGRVPRMPWGRLAAYHDKNQDKFDKAVPFLQTLDDAFKTLLPKRHAAQKSFTDKLDSKFRIADTVFTTLTVNKTFRTAAHLDAGDYGDGFSNLLVLSNDGNYSGGYLILPEYRVAVNVRPGDLLLIANHTAIHGNTPIELGSETSERVSVVAYAREDLAELGTWEYEQTRRAFVSMRKANKEHPDWWEQWNGVSPGMFKSQEWYDYLEQQMGEKVLLKYHPEARVSSLEDFF